MSTHKYDPEKATKKRNRLPVKTKLFGSVGVQAWCTLQNLKKGIVKDGNECIRGQPNTGNKMQ